ncbi:MAG: flagellar biosynthesis protein FlhB [Bacteriovoracaceae bacterium]
MDDDSDTGEKTEEPSLQRIEDFRKRGEVAVSKELNSVLVLVGTVFVTVLSIAYIYEEFEHLFEWINSQDLSKVFVGSHYKKFIHHIAIFFLKTIAPILATSFCLSFFCTVAQIGFLFSPDVLSIKVERLDPIKGMKKLFSVKALVEAVKSVMKFAMIIAITYFFMQEEVYKFMGFLHIETEQAFLYGQSVILKLIYSIIVGMAIVAVGDLAYQKMSYKKKLMMTKEQAKRESKEKDGNPEVKQRIRTIQREMAQKRMMNDVPDADVIVTNPTHISVALKFDTKTMVAPIVLAKGADNVALKIREIAKEKDIPIVENVPLARGIYKTVKVRHPIPRNFYKAVAEVLAFVYKLKRRKKALGSGVSARG